MKLKRIVTIITLLLSLNFSVVASVPIIDGGRPDKFMTIGLRAGITTSNISDNTLNIMPRTSQYNVFWRSGFHIGVMAEMAINNFFSIKTGCNFQTRAYDVTAMSSDSKTQSMNSSYTHSNYYYFSIPILLCPTINLGESARLSLELGAYLAHGIGGSRKRTSFAYQGSDDSDGYFGSNFSKGDYFGPNSDALIHVKRPDFGMVLGLELTVLKHYCIGAHYEAGLKNIALNTIENPSRFSLKNQAWRFSLGYNF